MFFDDRFKLFSIANDYEQNNLMIQELDKKYKYYLSTMNQMKNQLIFNFNEKMYISKLLYYYLERKLINSNIIVEENN